MSVGDPVSDFHQGRKGDSEKAPLTKVRRHNKAPLLRLPAVSRGPVKAKSLLERSAPAYLCSSPGSATPNKPVCLSFLCKAGRVHLRSKGCED